ncbi:hypothetical protein JTB14_032544 [Gonioctena quinquepunctata]|nr:hypothetical protein JTB14_032544 [Gonioctena quinquepunctata]
MKSAIILLWLSIVTINGHYDCTPVYGSETCAFLPAPPGKTPPCARPGMTYCEHPDHYPEQLIHYLIQKWRFDHSTLITSESTEHFSSYVYPSPSPTYGPPNYKSYGPPNFNHPEPIHIPKPQYPFHDNGDTYIPPSSYPVQNFTGYPDRKPYNRGQPFNFKYTNNFPQYQPQDDYYAAVDHPQYSPYSNHIWKRKIQNNYQRLKRSLRYNRYQQIIKRRIENGGFSNSTSHRSKRQSPSSGEALCRTRSRFVMPRAAVNNKGNWIYIVNMPEVNEKYSQLVRTEACAPETQSCNGICSLPLGYSSRCEQKFIQKRLVALEGGGNQLYTDLFWIPSCCVCTISNE